MMRSRKSLFPNFILYSFAINLFLKKTKTPIKSTAPCYKKKKRLCSKHSVYGSSFASVKKGTKNAYFCRTFLVWFPS